MAKIHDWQRIYWRNASGSREFFQRTAVDELSDEEQEAYDALVEDNDRALYQNENGDVVGYRISDAPDPIEPDEDADEDAEPQMPDDWHGKKYEVFFQGSDGDERAVIGPVEFQEDPQEWVSEEDERPQRVEQAAFDTRGEARKFTAAWRAEFGSPADLGYIQLEQDDLPEDYDELQDLAAEYGIKRNQSEDDLRDQLLGDEEPDFVSDRTQVAAE